MHRAPDGLLLQNGAGEPRRERVDGDEPPGDAAGALHRLKTGLSIWRYGSSVSVPKKR